MTEIVRAGSPEEVELERKRKDADLLAGDLVQAELDLATYRAELAAFEAKFVRLVGRLYAETDTVLAAVARSRAASSPGDPVVVAAAVRAEETAAESAAAASGAEQVRERFEAPPELRRLFREAARQMHPDLGVDDADRLVRHGAMARVNAAYQKADADELARLLREWVERPEAVRGSDLGAELVRLIRRIALLSSRIEAARAELAELRGTELGTLKQRAEEAHAAGRDLLEEMGGDAEMSLASARVLLDATRAETGNERL